MKTLFVTLLCIFSIHVFAEDTGRPKPKDLQPLPEAPPPPDVVVDPNAQPQITIVEKDGVKVEEYRLRGKLYAMKVMPHNAPPYYLVDERGDGKFNRRDNLDANMRIPNWVILHF